MSTSNLRYHPQQQKEVSTLAEGKIFVSLSPPCIYAYYSNSSVYIFHCLSKERFLHRKNRRISTECALYPIRVLSCTMINKKEVSTPEKNSYRNLYLCLHGKAFPLLQKSDFHTAQFVTATDSLQK